MFLSLFSTQITAIFLPDGHRITISDLGMFSDQNANNNICIDSKGILVWLILLQIYFWAALLAFKQEGKKKILIFVC